jgi:hypothetical protein
MLPAPAAGRIFLIPAWSAALLPAVNLPAAAAYAAAKRAVHIPADAPAQCMLCLSHMLAAADLVHRTCGRSGVCCVLCSNYVFEYLDVEAREMQQMNLQLGFPAHVVHIIKPGSPLFNLSLQVKDCRMLDLQR